MSKETASRQRVVDSPPGITSAVDRLQFLGPPDGNGPGP